MKAPSLKLVPTESEVRIGNIDIKELIEKVDIFQHKFGNEITVLYHQTEALEQELNSIIEGTDSRLKLEVFGAWQQVLKSKANLQVFKNR